MPIIRYQNQKIEVSEGSNLRKSLLQQQLSPHNGQTRWFNCKGMGTCGTCAVSVQGKVSKMTAMERWRLNFPPHQLDQGLRLACQCKVLGDVEVKKHDGFWGHVMKAP